ncbi:ferric-chelate reductase Frp1 [Fusarium torreyae]|uniref:ferric-chelate reductase (NADPH) n=1 Tax=Fusarium torreyae TaxID=1237075 RepID=A0A9W8RSK3_9HYPO|nr:ferric-chelate reductase Frp1 [Fusarium torreyae]
MGLFKRHGNHGHGHEEEGHGHGHGHQIRKTITVVAYTAFVAFLVTYKSIKHDAKFEERIAFRAAWITATQTSLPFLLAVRVNPIGLLLGTSYERINWFHRWASRVFFASATIHGGFFTYEWLKANFFWTELKTVKMVLPGIAAWFILAWTVISTIPFFRRIKYEVFVVQHIISVVLLLVFLVLHVPDHHLFSIWCAVGVFAYDVVTRSANPIWRNFRLRVSANPSVRYAHDASVEAVDDELTIMTIRNVGFSWVPGQHVLIWSPTFRWETPHPFTIANIPSTESKTQDVQLTIKTKTGMTRDLNDWARRSDFRGGDGSMHVLLTGPFGSVPNWKQYENVVLIAASTGGSFITPVLEDLLTSQSPGCVRKISVLYIVRRKAHAEPYLQRIARVLSRAKEMGISAKIEVAVTKGPQTVAEAVLNDDANESRERLIEPESGRGPSIELERFSLESGRSSESEREEQLLKDEVDLGFDGEYALDASSVEHTEGRPEIATFIRTAVGSVPGNVAVAVCGGDAIEKVVKTTVASIRADRSHDIYLHVERSDI